MTKNEGIKKAFLSYCTNGASLIRMIRKHVKTLVIQKYVIIANTKDLC